MSLVLFLDSPEKYSTVVFFSFRFYDRFRDKTNHIKPVLKDQKRNEIRIFHTFPHIFPEKSGGFAPGPPRKKRKCVLSPSR